MIRTLSPAEYRWTLSEHQFSEDDLNPAEKDRHGRPGALGQERALSALELGLGIRERGFNIFVVGASGTGRTSTVRDMLVERAAGEPTPNDLVLLYNFDDRDRPLSVQVPPSLGPKVKKRYDTLVEKMLGELEKVFESDGYIERRSELDANHQEKTDELLSGIEDDARAAGFILSRTGATLTLSVAGEAGAPMTEEAYESLPQATKDELDIKAQSLQGGLEDALRRVRALEKETDDKLEKLARETADTVVAPLILEAKQDLAQMSRVVMHLDALHKDVLDRLRRLVPEPVDEAVQGDEGAEPARSSRRRAGEDDDENDDRDEPALIRYRVNVLVSHQKNAGAPVVQETHPTASNLIGRIEHRVRGGETVTDFTRIKAGALYRSNGGYLLLHAQDLLRDLTAWEGLKRALKNRQIELDDPGEPGRMVSIASLRPEPVPLSVKICLIGTPELYYSLSRGDPDFSKLFKVKVDFDIEMERNDDRIHNYLRFLAGLAHEEKLRPLTPSGAARVLEHAARICDDQHKLTTRFGDIADLVREASFWAGKAEAPMIERGHVRRALEARAEREGFIELRMREDIVSRRIQIETSGEVVGQVNGLTVIDLGSYAFGMPVRITCKVGAGKGEIIDIERETELGGPIHTKGTLILKGILVDRFGQRTPLCMAAILCMEQSYSDIDGDSASLAEACALFSSLSEAPIRQRIGVTGSVDQLGRVQAVGGVNEKIEGFWRAAMARDPKGTYEVIIPESNARDLMLDEDVLAAAQDGRFVVRTAETIEDALEILTGKKWRGGKTALEPVVLHRLMAFADVQAETNRAPTRKKTTLRALPKAAKARSRRR